MTHDPREALKPCPFCGGEPELLNGGPGNWFVRCKNCKCSTNDVHRDAAVQLWHRRSALTASPGEQQPVAWADSKGLERPIVAAAMEELCQNPTTKVYWERFSIPLYTSPPPIAGWDVAVPWHTSGLPSDPTAERREIVALGDLVTVNELAPYFGDWRGVTLKVVGLRLTPDGEEWASVIEGDQRHRGNGQYDGETDGFNVQWLSKCAALDGGAGA